jgi:hypothetical protein
MSAIIHAFPAVRHVRMIKNIARYMAQLPDAEAESYLVRHFDVEWGRLIECGVSDEEIEKYIFTTARAIWSLLSKIRAGAA